MPADSATPGDHVRVVEGPYGLEQLYTELTDILTGYPFSSVSIVIDNLAYSMRNLPQGYLRKFMILLM